MLTLLIDDIREFNADYTARNSETAKELLTEIKFDQLYIDYDLGEDVSGYDIVEWANLNNCLPEVIFIVSMNPVGVSIIRQYLLSIGYKMKSSPRMLIKEIK